MTAKSRRAREEQGPGGRTKRVRETGGYVFQNGQAGEGGQVYFFEATVRLSALRITATHSGGVETPHRDVAEENH